ncbi:hypothetical protein [Streptomyces sp. YIM 132580]|uniref:hypothetical protein n=1 Tax=Streptomyces sp. YIM 132580 TaxID=2691958 RepID=UPI001369EC22|nr:hypothetical protein [Streptomyces sp. YIM 132580]MXG30369.1 hypothetical protein [Streptomyces sp. YIM 132580]
MRQLAPTEVLLLGLLVLVSTILVGVIAVSYPMLIPAMTLAFTAMATIVALTVALRS